MTNYVNQAKYFLENCNATIKMMYIGQTIPENWGKGKKHDTYIVNISTPRGNMQVKFYDSIVNTNKNKDLTLNGLHRKYKPTAYDILSCLTTCDVGSIEDFISEFGYEIKKPGDFKRILNTYKAVKKEYEDVCRCFTEEQIEQLQKIG